MTADAIGVTATPARTRLDAIAADALRHYDLGPDPRLTLLSVSENATYRVDDAATGTRTVLRVHRRGYHTEDAIRSELAWVRALRDDGAVRTPGVVETKRGLEIAVARHPDGEARHVAMFDWLPGAEPSDDLVGSFAELGAITARLHLHARGWRRPAGFTRFTWNWETCLGPDGHWGHWSAGPAVGPAERELFERTAQVVRERLAAFGSGPDRFGLIHADMRLANLLLHGSDIHVIDFDDCGLGWYLYDLAGSLSFIEHQPEVPELIDAWVRGYRGIASLSAEEEAELPTFVMLRRLQLIAWIGSHADTEQARLMGADYTSASRGLAESYLSRFNVSGAAGADGRS
jgi:Ser/Thr protein kinase RdoA (MazF antagonist)